MTRIIPFQCFRKPDTEAAAASGDSLQTDDRNINIIAVVLYYKLFLCEIRRHEKKVGR